MSNERFLSELRQEVVDATERSDARRRPARRGRSGRLLAAAAILLLVAVAAVVSRPGTTEATVEVIVDATGITIRLTDLASRPDEVEKAIRDAGLAVQVTEVPVGPSNVGKFIAASGTALPQTLRVVEGDPTSAFSGFRLPLDFDGTLELRLGREAEPGEEWGALSDATAPGELLACQDVLGQTVAQVMERGEQSGADEQRVMLLDQGRWLSNFELVTHGQATVVRVGSPEPGALWIDASVDPERFQPPVPLPPNGC